MTSYYCGDGVIQAGERCDAGLQNGKEGQNCTVTCQELVQPLCGNIELDAGEECDDGNQRSGDGCNAQCRIEYGSCGDGITNVALGEQCDAATRNGTEGADCDAKCKWTRLPQCGDGAIDPSTEQCDAGRANGNYRTTTCLDNCSLPFCGDGIAEINERCDDGNMLDGDGCDHTCRFEPLSIAPVIGKLVPTEPQGTIDLEPQMESSSISSVESSMTISSETSSSAQSSSAYEITNVPTPAASKEGPGLVIFLASGAAAGIGLARRRLFRRR